MLEAVTTDLVFTIRLKRSTKIFSYPQAGPADYTIFRAQPTCYRILEFRKVKSECTAGPLPEGPKLTRLTGQAAYIEL
jgi:hypothetical protein